MKRFPLTAVAAVAIATIASRPRFPDDMSSTKILNIENDGDSAVAGGGQAASSGQAATDQALAGDEIVKSGYPGDAVVAAMAGQQQQAEAPDTPQADGVIEAKGMIVGDDDNATATAMGDQADANPAQQT